MSGDQLPGRITNPKLTDLQPTWARFPGWSVIFDDPSGAIDLAGPTDGAALAQPARRVDLYDRLEELAATVAQRLEPAIRFARLPVTTFHVTVLDGISPSSLPAISDRSAHLWWQRVLCEVPAVRPVDRAMVARLVAPLVEACEVSIRLRPTRLAVRGHAVLVDLEAADRWSWHAVLTLGRARAATLHRLSRQVGGDLVTAWQPHVTLGYLADRADAAPADLAVADLSAPSDAITFGSANVYWFESMVSFHRSGRARRAGRRGDGD